MADAQKQAARPEDDASGNEKVLDALLYGAGMIGAVMVLLFVRWLLSLAGVLAGDDLWEGIGVVAAFMFAVMVAGGAVYGLLGDILGWMRGRDASTGRPASD